MTAIAARLSSVPARIGGGARFVWARWWGKALVGLVALAALAVFLLWLLVIRGLPSVEQLRTYEPPLPTHVRGGDGNPVQSYARERRVELSFAEYPPLLVKAFLAAEDRTFFDHHGLDYPGLVRAAWQGLTSGNTPRGTSTITQQVAKNLLVGNEASYARKLKEAILAWKIEDTLSKEQILELYLNQIALGRNAFGVEAAAHAYFDKELNQLTLAQMAYLAILPKGPANYDPVRHADRALERRGYVLREMLKNDFITQAQYAEASAEPLGTVLRRTPRVDPSGGYFVEEVRRQLIARFGETAKATPNSVYEGGLWVRTSLDDRLQRLAAEALRAGLIRYEGGRGWSGPIRHLDIDGQVEGGNWQQALLNTNIGIDYQDWRAAVAIAREGSGWSIGFADGRTGTLPAALAQMPRRGTTSAAFGAIEPGDVIAVAPSGSQWSLRSVPRISGGFVVQEPATGRILAMQGGFDSRLQAFNRATQAQRQPGSTIKPIVYSAALENGMSPASIIVDGPFCVYQGARLGQKCFRNFANMRSAGPRTMRWGIEQSRNLMTVRTAAQIGMPRVVDTMKRMGVGDYSPYLAIALGAGETTVARMVNAYAMLANQGRGLNEGSLVDFVQDRHGKVIWPENWRPCDGCNAPAWNGGPMPRPPVRMRQAIDAQSAYQMVHITEGVIQRGTATVLRDLDRPMFGKTGTTTGPTDVWFIGGTPQFIGGLYIGYDNPRRLGAAEGGTVAAPIFKQFAVKAYEGLDKLPFRAPAGIRMVRIDRMSGKPVFGTFPDDSDPKPAVIWEAFKPETEPRRAARHAGPATGPTTAATAAPAAPRDSEFLQREGGIY
ncbi:transglycosylase domain-containing protein [Sphingomonas sp. KR1UV-12]|uniref:Penicillin-binding protein 1A n=1 Tax=Sphingomonas aurea TaxID=3063994 RepID=A0ABT9ENZ2_9SPHN|nr:transglycosylase domain-containing protein [Sphingomonas sp. KR1UV-12]MDP1028373.1 transglycosylase domain-containing protein [Sphingomonas sp. KR1UV-12]